LLYENAPKTDWATTWQVDAARTCNVTKVSFSITNVMQPQHQVGRSVLQLYRRILYVVRSTIGLLSDSVLELNSYCLYSFTVGSGSLWYSSIYNNISQYCTGSSYRFSGSSYQLACHVGVCTIALLMLFLAHVTHL